MANLAIKQDKYQKKNQKYFMRAAIYKYAKSFVIISCVPRYNKQ